MPKPFPRTRWVQFHSLAPGQAASQEGPLIFCVLKNKQLLVSLDFYSRGR